MYIYSVMKYAITSEPHMCVYIYSVMKYAITSVYTLYSNMLKFNIIGNAAPPQKGRIHIATFTEGARS